MRVYSYTRYTLVPVNQRIFTEDPKEPGSHRGPEGRNSKRPPFQYSVRVSSLPREYLGSFPHVNESTSVS